LDLRGRSGAVGGTLDAAPRSAWSGRIVIAKPVDPTRGQVNEMSAAGVAEPTLAAGNPDPLRRAAATS
jgi:hypothetical protein